jgi:hypothetical protein
MVAVEGHQGGMKCAESRRATIWRNGEGHQGKNSKTELLIQNNDSEVCLSLVR